MGLWNHWHLHCLPQRPLVHQQRGLGHQPFVPLLILLQHQLLDGNESNSLCGLLDLRRWITHAYRMQ